MEKLKSILSPGKAKDDEVLYGQGNSGAVSGEGSHFPSSGTTGTGVGNTSSVGGTSTGLGHNTGASTLGSTSSATGQTSHNPLSSNTSTSHNPLSSSTDQTSSGVGGYGSTGSSGMPGTFGDESTSSNTGRGGLTAGELVGAGSQTGNTYGTSGLTGNNNQTTGTSNLTGNTTRHHTGRDAALGAGAAGLAGEGIHHHRENERAQQSGTSGVTGNTYPSGTSGTSGTSGFTGNNQQTTGVSGLTGNTTQHHTGRDAALGAGAAGLAGEGIHHHREHEQARDSGLTSGSGYGTTATGSSAGTSSSPYTGTTASGQTAGAYHGGPQGTAVKGPHSTSTANALDPSLHNTRSSELESAHVHEADSTGTRAGGGGAEEADAGHGGHKGRDAALGAGAVGLGGAAYEHHKHDKDLTAAEREAKREHKHELKEEKKHAHDQKHAHDSTTSHSTTDHHTGRDAALGAGAGAGALGVAEHERTKHSNVEGSGPGSAVAAEKTAQQGNLPGPAPNTAGPHSKDWMNKLDPRVDSAGPATGSTGSLATTDTTGTDHAMKNRNAYVDPEARNNPGFVDSPQHPVGRSGLVGASGAGSSGVGAHDGSRGLTNQAGRPGSTTGILEGTTGNTHSNLGSGGVPTSTATQQHHKDHHLGRDAAGAGVVGGAAYEAEKHHHNKGVNDPNYSSTTGTSGYPATGATTGTHDTYNPTHKDHHLGRDAAGAGVVGGAAYEAEKHHHNKGVNDPNYASTTGTSAYQSGTATGTHDPTHKEHHYGRDTAGAGVVGGAAYEAEKHHKHDKDLTAAEREAKKEHKHEEKLEKKHEKEEKKSHGGGLLSFLHRDKSKKYTKEEEDEFDRQEREHNSHKGRDAAALGGAGAVGAGAYEAEKHHGHSSADTNKALPNEPGNTYGTSSNLADRSLQDSSTGHHAGSHAQKWEGGDGPATEYAPPGTTLGDKLHGVDRNRGVSNTEFGTGDRNRLHKDPPASHPASHGGMTSDGRAIEQGTGKVSSTPIYDANSSTGSSGIGHSGLGQSSGSHVPASSETRRDIVRDGESRLDTDTGVHNAGHQQTGSTNY